MSVRAGSGVALSGGAAFCSPALSLTARMVDAVAMGRSVATSDLVLDDALPSCGSSTALIVDDMLLSLPSVTFSPAAWEQVGAVDAVAILAIAQWGLPLVSQNTGWQSIAESAISSSHRRRVVSYSDYARGARVLRGPRRLTPSSDCSGLVADAVYLNVTEANGNASHRVVSARGIDSRVLSVSLEAIDGSPITAWGGESSLRDASVRVAVPFLQGIDSLRQTEAEYPARSVRLQCPDSGEFAVPLPIGANVSAWYTSPALIATDARVISTAPVWGIGVTGTQTLLVYTVGVDCGLAGIISVECAKDHAVDSAPSVFSCPAYQWSPVCGFWDPVNASWSSAGCLTSSTSTTSVVCECSHLTEFAARFAAVVDSQPLVFAAAVCFESPTAVADAAGLWSVVATLLAAYALLATMGEVADDVASQQYERFLSSHPDLNLVTNSEEDAGDPAAASNLLLDALAGALAEGAPIVDGIPVAVIAPPPCVSELGSSGQVTVASTAKPALPTPAPRRSAPCWTSLVACGVSVSASTMTLACCARSASGKYAKESSCDAGDPAAAPATSTTHHCCCCFRLTSTRGRPRPRMLACLPRRYSLALYRRYRALLVLGPGDETARSASAVSEYGGAKQPSDGSADARSLKGRLDADATLLAALECPVWWRRVLLLRGLVLHVWVLRVLTCHPILSAFTRFDPFRPRANRLAVAVVTALASLFYTAFYFGFRGSGSARVGGNPGTLPPATAADLVVVTALAIASGLPLRLLLAWCMRHAGEDWEGLVGAYDVCHHRHPPFPAPRPRRVPSAPPRALGRAAGTPRRRSRARARPDCCSAARHAAGAP